MDSIEWYDLVDGNREIFSEPAEHAARELAVVAPISETEIVILGGQQVDGSCDNVTLFDYTTKSASVVQTTKTNAIKFSCKSGQAFQDGDG